VNPALIGDATSQPCSSHIVCGEWLRSIDPKSLPGFEPLLFGGTHSSGVETDIVKNAYSVIHPFRYGDWVLA